MATFTYPVPAPPMSYPSGLSSLYQVAVFSGKTARADYASAAGVEAPAFDPTKPVKRWRIDSDTPLTLGYYTSDLKYMTRAYSVAELASVNIPGRMTYPKWTPAPSGAYMVDPSGSRATLSASGLSTRAQADALIAELQAAGWGISGVQQYTGGHFEVFYDSNESRRYWMVEFSQAGIKNTAAYVGLLLGTKYNGGVGAPGRWSTPSEAAQYGMFPAWVPAVIIDDANFSAMPDTPTPARALHPNEEWKITPFGAMLVLKSSSASTATGSETNAALDEIRTNVRFLVERSKLS